LKKLFLKISGTPQQPLDFVLNFMGGQISPGVGDLSLVIGNTDSDNETKGNETMFNRENKATVAFNSSASSTFKPRPDIHFHTVINPYPWSFNAAGSIAEENIQVGLNYCKIYLFLPWHPVGEFVFLFPLGDFVFLFPLGDFVFPFSLLDFVFCVSPFHLGILYFAFHLGIFVFHLSGSGDFDTVISFPAVGNIVILFVKIFPVAIHK
jgi:hypothetical protein